MPLLHSTLWRRNLNGQTAACLQEDMMLDSDLEEESARRAEEDGHVNREGGRYFT